MLGSSKRHLFGYGTVPVQSWNSEICVQKSKKMSTFISKTKSGMRVYLISDILKDCCKGRLTIF
jgi:hypothetical protein